MGYAIDEAAVAHWGRCSGCLAQARSHPALIHRRALPPSQSARTEGPTTQSTDLEELPLPDNEAATTPR